MMKRHLLFAMLCIVGAISMNAQGTWTAPAVPGVDLSGTAPTENVYMYNVEADAFVTNGMNWNTNAIAMRLKAGDTALSSNQSGKITISGTSVKFSTTNYSGQGVGTNGGTNDVWADFGGNFNWNFTASTTVSGAYTLENTSFVGQKLDVSWKYGGHLTIKEGYGNYDWAFIKESDIQNGAYAAYKARKDMYAIYQDLAENGKTSDYATELAAANAVYTNSSSTAADIIAATRTLLIAVAPGITSEVPASALFTNPDMVGAWSASDWGANPAKNLGDLEVFHANVTLTQTQNDVPNGLYRIVFHGLYRQDGSNAAPVVSAQTVTGNVVEMRTLNYACENNGGGNGWKNNNGWIPDNMKSAAEALTHTGAVTVLENVLVNENSLTISTKVNSTSQWFNFQGFEIYFQPVDLSALEAQLIAVVDLANGYQGRIPTAAYNALDAVVQANNGTYTTAEDYDEAIGNIQTALGTYATDEMIAAYGDYLAMYSKVNALTNVDVTDAAKKAEHLSTLNSALNAIITTVESQTTDYSAVAAQTPNLPALGLAYVDGLTPSDPDNESFDISFIIVNPEINGITGWTADRPLGGNGPLLNNVSMEYWAGNASNRAEASFDYYQVLSNLPNGTYRVSAEMYNSLNSEGGDYTVFSPTSGVYGQANNTEYTLVDVDGTTLTPYTTADVTTTDGTLRIGVKNFVTPMAARWFVADNFKLFYTGSVDIQAYIDAYLEALRNARTTAASNEKMANWVLTELNTTISNNDEDHVDMNSQSALEAATAALIEANTLGQKSIHSYQVIAQGFVPDDQLDGWVCENDQTFHINTWSTEGGPNLAGDTRDSYDGTGMVTPFIENWTGNGGLLGAGKVYYRLEGLEPGEVYRVEALVRSYNEASADAPNGPNFYVLDDVADLTEVGTTFTYNNMSGIYGTQVAAATIGADGVLELGVIIDENRNYNWVAFKNIKIGSFEDALAAAIAAAEELDGAVAPGYYDNNIQALIDGCSGNNYPTTADEFISAIAALEQAVADADPAKESYKGYLKLKPYADALVAVPNDNAGENSTLARAIADAENAINTLTTVEENDAANAALREAMDTYATLANPQGDGAKFDLTYMLTNPDVTPFWDGEPGDASSGTWGIVPDGWGSDQEDGNKQVMTNADVVNGDKTIFYEYWSDPAKANGLFTLYNTAPNLPDGFFEMSCYAFASPNNVEGATNNQVYFYANDTQGSLVANAQLSEQHIEFKNATRQDVKIGLKALSGNQFRWMGIGYVKLYKVPAKAFIIDEDDDDYDYTQDGAGDVIIRNRIIKEGYNTLVLPFSMTQSEVEQAFGQGAKISVVASYDVDKEHLRFTAQDGVVANRPCLLNATQPNDGSDINIEGRTLVPASSLYPTYEAPNVVMTGTYETQTYVPENSWFMQNGSLVYAPDETSCWVNLGRAYITLGDGSHPVKGLTVSFEDGATGIAIIENGEMNILTGKIYDLSGREVQNPTRGIYIINGKKVMIK